VRQGFGRDNRRIGVAADTMGKKYLKRTRKWFKVIFSRKKGLSRPKSGGPHGFGRFGTVDGASPEHIELPITNTADQQTPLFNKETNLDGYVLDSNCITWVFGMSMDPDVIVAIMDSSPRSFGMLTSRPLHSKDSTTRSWSASTVRPDNPW